MKNAILVTLTLVLFCISATAQDGKPAEPQPTPQPAMPDARGQMMREIGLTQDQVRQMRRLNMERKPLMEEAQTRVRDANRLLDEAIYADDVNETEIRSRLKEAQLAQADLFRIRSANELAIRKILTPEQLIHFRDLRRRFEEARQNMELRRNENRMNRKDPAAMPFREGQKRVRPNATQDSPVKQP